MKHYMVDIETTGTRADRNGMIQLAAVRFDLDARTIETESMFCAGMAMPPWRSWDEDTRRWWRQQNPAVLQGILDTMRDPATVLAEFDAWCQADGETRADERWFWAKNAAFDFSFVQSYHHDLGLEMPFHYRSVRDMKCFVSGRCWPRPLPAVEQPKTDLAHNALVDCIQQIDWLFKALDATAA